MSGGGKSVFVGVFSLLRGGVFLAFAAGERVGCRRVCLFLLLVRDGGLIFAEHPHPTTPTPSLAATARKTPIAKKHAVDVGRCLLFAVGAAGGRGGGGGAGFFAFAVWAPAGLFTHLPVGRGFSCRTSCWQ